MTGYCRTISHDNIRELYTKHEMKTFNIELKEKWKGS